MSFDPTKPVEDSPLDAAEMRDQFNALKALNDGLQATVDSQQAAINDLQLNVGDNAAAITNLQAAFDSYVASHP